jgi:glycine/D-amino acid oxidase-like deaminating enzyme
MAVFDVVVVGAGYIGSAISYYLTRAGLKTALVDRGGLAAGASRANYGDIQVQDAELNDSLPMVLAGRATFDTLQAELESSFDLRTLGSLLIAEAESQVPGLRTRAETLRQAGVSVEWLSPAALAHLEPSLDVTQTCGALYNPNEAQINPFKLIWAFIQRARQQGLRLLFHTPVEDFIVAGDTVQGVVTPQGRLQSKITILATGAWGAVLGQKLGLQIPVKHVHGQAAVTGYVGNVLTNYISSAAFFESVHHRDDLANSNPKAVLAIAPTVHGNLLLGEAGEEVAHFDYSVCPDSVLAISELTLRFLPRLRSAQILRSWGVPVAFTTDDKPFVGPVEGLEGLLLALAFKSTVVITPLIGQTIAQLVTEGYSDLDISPFLLSRIDNREC